MGPTRNALECRKYRKKLRERAYNAIGHCCVFCGVWYDLQCAHIHPTGLKGASRGLTRRYLDVIAHPRRYRPMCVECHGKFDRGELGFQDMKHERSIDTEQDLSVPF